MSEPIQNPRDLVQRLRYEYDEDIAEAEARGAALALEQVRRMAEALAAREDGYADQIISPIHVSQKHRFGGSLIRELLASLPATTDLAEEVRRIEERERTRIVAWLRRREPMSQRSAAFLEAADLIEGGAT